MLEILIIVFISKRIRKIAEEKHIDPTRWTRRLVGIWFAIEFATVILYIIFTGSSIEDSMFMTIPAMFLSGIGAYLLVRKLQNAPDETTDLSDSLLTD